MPRTPDEPIDPLAWAKKYEVLSFSRLTLESLGMTHEQVASLTDDELEHLADRLQGQYLSVFFEKLRFFVSIYLAERNWNNG